MIVEIVILEVKEKWSTHTSKYGQEYHCYASKDEIVYIVIFVFDNYEVSGITLRISLAETGISLTSHLDTR